jgi:RNA polymerase sigma-70 factor (ECF subfamily)
MVQSSRSAQDRDSIASELDARFRAPLMAYFLRRTGSRNEAEDLTQETFVRLIGSDSFMHAQEADAFVFRVASNLLQDRARSVARRKQVHVQPLEAQSEISVDRLATENREPERVLMAKESLIEVLECLNELSERTRSIFILFRLEGMKQKDIAQLYGLGVSTVEKHVMAAALHLARRFNLT